MIRYLASSAMSMPKPLCDLSAGDTKRENLEGKIDFEMQKNDAID